MALGDGFRCLGQIQNRFRNLLLERPGKRVGHQDRSAYNKAHNPGIKPQPLVHGSYVGFEVECAHPFAALHDWLKGGQMRVFEAITVLSWRGGKGVNRKVRRIR